MKRYVIFICCIFIVMLLLGAPVRNLYAPIKYRAVVKEYASKYNLDWLLVMSIIYHESRFRPGAISPKGAIGLMQVMPDTGSEAARKMGWGEIAPKDLFDSRKNIDIGCYYFSRMMKEFGNEPKIALAAYNAGRGSVYKWWSKDSDGILYSNNVKPSYIKIAKYLYPETKRYVHKVYGTYKLLGTLDKIWKI